MRRVETLPDAKGYCKPRWEEWVYLGDDGEYIRERWAHHRHHGRNGERPPSVVRVIFPDNNRPAWLNAELTADSFTEEMKAEAQTVQIINKVYKANLFASDARITNADIARELFKLGLTEPRQFPKLEFYVDELRGARAAGVETRMQMVKRQGEQVCLLTTNGDRSDLDGFLEQVFRELRTRNGILTQRGPQFSPEYVRDCEWCPRAPLTVRMREIAIRLGAKETTSQNTEAWVRAEMAQARKVAELLQNRDAAIERERRSAAAVARLEEMAAENRARFSVTAETVDAEQGEKVTRWADQTDNGHDFIQGNPEQAPTLEPGPTTEE